MKNIARLLVFLSVSVAILAGCREDQPLNPVLLELDRTNMKMVVGQSQKLNALLQGSSEKLVWTASDEAVASVGQDGLVKAVGAGQTVITVAAGNAFENCNVEVSEFKADKLLLNSEIADGALILAVGSEFKLEPRFYKSEEKVNDMAYPSYSLGGAVPARDGESVASVDSDGLIKATAPGTVEVTVTGAGVSSSFKLTVKELILDKTSLEMYVQETAELSVSMLPTNLPESEKTMEWYSSDMESVSVDSEGRVKALKATSSPVEIIAVANGVSAVCKVTVTEFVATSVEFADLGDVLRVNDGMYEMYVGDNPVVVHAVFKDAQGNDVSSKVIDRSFASTDASVAAITSDGMLSVNGPGKVTVKVSGAGVESSFELAVIQGVESLTVSPSVLKTVYEGSDPFTIVANVFPENASVRDVTFVSDNPDVASVNSTSGLVSIGHEGVAKIIVSTKGCKRPLKGADGKYIYETLTTTLIVNVLKEDAEEAHSVVIQADGIHEGTLIVQKGTEVQLTAVSESATFSGTYTWMVTKENISVDESGKLAAHAVGTSTVVLIAVSDSGQTATCELPVNVTGVNPTSIEIINGEGLSAVVNDIPVILEARAVSPSNADFAGVNWYSSDEDVVEVDANGKLTYVGIGKAVVTAVARSWDGSAELTDVKDEFALEILNTAVTDFDIVCKSGGIYHNGIQYLEEGASLQLECVTIPHGAEPNTVVWKSSQIETAKVSADGTVTGGVSTNESGTDVVITCIVDAKIEHSFYIKVIKVQPKDIVVTLPDHPLKVGEQWPLNPKVIPESLGFYPSNTLRSPVNSSGVFQSDTPGSISFGFFVSSTQSASIISTLQRYFTISVEPYWVTELVIPETLAMDVGASTSIIPEFKSDVDGVQPTYTDVKWSSADPSVVSINETSGEMTAHKSGTVDIIATTSNEWSVPSGSDQKSAICRVTVSVAENPIHIGDYVYSDGTWSTELESAKTPVGVVFALVNATSADPQLKALYPEASHALAVSLTEYKSAISMVDGTGYSWTSVSDFAIEQGNYASMANTGIACGFSNTMAMKAFKDAKGDYSNYLDVLAGHNVSVTGASSWYLPSEYELSLLAAQYSLVNEKLTAAGATQLEKYTNSWSTELKSGLYWSSTYLQGQGSQSKPYILSEKMLHATMLMHQQAHQIRFVFAF